MIYNVIIQIYFSGNGEIVMKNNKVDMLTGPISKGLLTMIMPLMIMNVIQTLFNVVDMMVLKIYSNDGAVGAVGACGTLLTLSITLLTGLSVGTNVVVARRIGTGNKEKTDNAVMTSIIVAIIGGLILMCLGVTFAEFVLRLTNCPEVLLPQAVKYFQIYFWGVPVTMLYTFAVYILRAIGNTKKIMYFSVSAGIFKVILTFLFVSAFNMNVAGVGLATIISNLIGCSLCFYELLKKQDVVHINFRKIRIDIKELKEILLVGIPSGLQTALYSVANVVITTVVNGFGADATTGISIANQFDGIMYQIIYAPSLATTPYVSQNIGAGNMKRAKKAILSSVLITTGFGATLGFLSAFFSSELSSIMSSNPAIIAYSRQKMIIISSTYFIQGINEVLGGALRGMGKPIVPTVVTFIFMFAFRFFWIYCIYPLCPNLTFLYAVWPVGWVLSIITLLIVYFREINK